MIHKLSLERELFRVYNSLSTVSEKIKEREPLALLSKEEREEQMIKD